MDQIEDTYDKFTYALVLRHGETKSTLRVPRSVTCNKIDIANKVMIENFSKASLKFGTDASLRKMTPELGIVLPSKKKTIKAKRPTKTDEMMTPDEIHKGVNEIMLREPLSEWVDEDDAPRSSNKKPKKNKDKNSLEWQLKNWPKFYFNDIFSDDIMTMLRNWKRKSPLASRIKFHAYMRIATEGIFQHDWLLALKALDIFTNTYREGRIEHKSPFVWMIGFLTVCNLYPSDIDKVFVLKDSAKATLSAHPRRFDLEVAIWLIQKGHYRLALNILKDSPRFYVAGRDPYTLPYFPNPKNSMIHFVSDVILSSEEYATWKLKSKRLERQLDCDGMLEDDDVADLRREGETALSSYENLLRDCIELKVEVTILLKPLIELMVEYRGSERAKQVFNEILVHYFGNAFVEKAYLKFLRKYFPDNRKEIATYEEFEKKFIFPNIKPKFKEVPLQVKKIFDKKLAQESTPKVFVQIPNPCFCFSECT